MHQIVRRSFTPVIYAAIAFALSAYSQTSPAGVQRITSVEGITEYRLPNGLQVLLFPDNSKPTVTVNVTYLVGARHEGYGESGMAHLLEHMLFKGTAKRAEVVSEIRNHASAFNGTTAWDRTNYFETMTATDENLHWALDMESDRMVNSRVSRQDLDTEMTVVRNEFENGENNPQNVLRQRVMSTAYLWHGYGRAVIGARSDIEKVPIDRLQAFYHNYYQPDNAILVVTGKYDPAKALNWVQETFGAIPKPTRKLNPTYTEEPVQDGERDVTLRRVGDTQAVVAAYHIPAASHPDFAALEVLAGVIGDNPAGRLYKALVDSKKAVAANANALQLHDPGLLLLYASLRREQSLDDVQKTMLQVVEGVVKEQPSKEEVDRQRTRLLKEFELMLNDSSRVGLIISEAAAAGDWRLLFTERDDLQKVTPADVARVAKQYLKPDNMTLGRFIPTEAPDRSDIPASPDLVSKLKDYKGNAPVQEGEVFEPTPANIEARVVRATLSGGLKLVLLPKKNRGGTVVAAISLHFGDEKTLMGKTAVARLTGAVLIRGTQKHTRQQLQDELDRLKVRLNVGGSVTGANASLETVQASLAPALRLAAEVLREPSLPESELEQIRQTLLAGLENSRSEPTAIAAIALNRHFASPYPADDPRAVQTLDEQIAGIKKVTLADVKKFYADFYGASNGELAVVGDFDPAEVQKVAAELFGTWKSPSSYSQVKRTWQKLDPINQSFETPDKANAMVLGAITLNLDDDDPDYAALWIANNIFGSSPNSRLFTRIRGKDGLSYGVGTAYNAGPQEKYGQLAFQAIANPQNAPKVQAAFKEELNRAVTQGFTAEEVETAKKQFAQDNAVQMSQDAFLASTLARYTQYNRTMVRLADMLKRVQTLTADQVNAAFKKWIDPAQFSYVMAGDFKKAGVTP
ncbi:MAG: insulinase family protein [Bryobacterales bacterium]|nr:insulinase family protein [Bryobacterales bacterium]MBV9400900.1 insulinase family protein [Bryobacterales bacterium]